MIYSGNVFCSVHNNVPHNPASSYHSGIQSLPEAPGQGWNVRLDFQGLRDYTFRLNVATIQ